MPLEFRKFGAGGKPCHQKPSPCLLILSDCFHDFIDTLLRHHSSRKAISPQKPTTRHEYFNSFIQNNDELLIVDVARIQMRGDVAHERQRSEMKVQHLLVAAL